MQPHAAAESSRWLDREDAKLQRLAEAALAVTEHCRTSSQRSKRNPDYDNDDLPMDTNERLELA